MTKHGHDRQGGPRRAAEGRRHAGAAHRRRSSHGPRPTADQLDQDLSERTEQPRIRCRSRRGWPCHPRRRAVRLPRGTQARRDACERDAATSGWSRSSPTSPSSFLAHGHRHRRRVPTDSGRATLDNVSRRCTPARTSNAFRIVARAFAGTAVAGAVPGGLLAWAIAVGNPEGVLRRAAAGRVGRAGTVRRRDADLRLPGDLRLQRAGHQAASKRASSG